METLIQQLREFQWSILGQLFGCAHSSTIGFLASQWIAADPANHAVIDGPPCVFINIDGQNRKRCADLLMFSQNQLGLVVEVDQLGKSREYYQTKISMLKAYIKKFESLSHGLLVLYGDQNSNTIEDVVQLLHNDSNGRILLIHLQAVNELMHLQQHNETTLARIRLQSGYYFWRRTTVKLYIPGRPEAETLWRLNRDLSQNLADFTMNTPSAPKRAAMPNPTGQPVLPQQGQVEPKVA